ncbi:NSFL1 cofactor p47 [Anabrus simplex]|uniref:NSFL1 cofactor p47 n=1 Tax=Anabrus simplex TaxID=316456 RepID=UPI0035A28A46
MSDTADKESVDEERSRLIENFVQITGSNAEKARDNLEWSMWDLGVALERYYGKMDMGEQQDDLSDPEMPELVPAHAPSSAEVGRRNAREERTRFSTIADLEGADSSDDEDAQAYYAGGSEHSGQQVLGPPSRKKKKDIIADILKSAQQVGAEVVDPAKPSSSTTRESFSGTGYRLGQSESDTQVVPSALGSRGDSDSSQVTLKLWKEGFNINDGPLREYDDPENSQFLDSVRQGLIPPELTSNVGNAVVHLNLEDHHHESFTSFRAPKVRPFSGQGHILGRPTPAFVRTKTEEGEHPQGDVGVAPSFELDDSKPTTTIAIRLPDGSRLNGVFNHTHTVGDIRAFINQTHPEFAQTQYSLQTTIPTQELKDNNVTIVKAELFSSVLIMRLKK